jgi:putative transposase
MPRLARTYLPGYPYHIVQRGNNREACFISIDDYQFYLDLWDECARRYGVCIHAWCLMTNHIHFLVTPDRKDSISFAMKVIGSRYAQYFNKTYRRTGTLWEGRHKSSLVQSDRYLLTCMRYIELNPVAAGMVDKPEEYRWSSYLSNAWGRQGLIIPHVEYLKLSGKIETRRHAYRELFRSTIDSEDIHTIESAAAYCRPVGDNRFCEQIASRYGIEFPRPARGRPAKEYSG